MDRQEIIDLYIDSDEEIKQMIEELLDSDIRACIADRDCNHPL